MQDSVAGTQLLHQAAVAPPGIRKAWVDGGYRKHFVEHAAILGIDLDIVEESAGGCSTAD